MSRFAWIVMSFLSVAVAAYAIAILVHPEWGPPFVGRRMAETPAMALHMAGGAWALAVGPWQFSRRLRARALNLHRWLGRSYVAAVLVGGLAAIAMAPVVVTGAVAGLGFATLGVLWLIFTALALVRIRQGDDVAHQRWMTRSFALTLAAVTLRFYLPASIAAGIPFESAYPVIAWMCWVPNLLVAEWMLGPAAASRSRLA